MGRPEWSTDLANEEVLCVIMIETRGGLANLAEDFSPSRGSTPSLVGAVDLSLTHGVFGDEASRRDLVEQVFEGCRAKGVPHGIAVSSPADARAGAEAGATLVALSPDAWLLGDAIKDYLKACGLAP